MGFFAGILFVFALVVLFRSVRIVRQSQVGIIERLGRFNRLAESGLNLVLPFIERIAYMADLREQVHTFDPQPMITKDNATVHINAVTYFRITDPKRVLYEVENFESALEQLIITTLRNLLGELELDETLNARSIVNEKLQITLDEVTGNWGIKVTRVEVKEVTPSPDIADAMSKQMVAERTRRAAILEAEGMKASAILKAEGAKEAAVLDAQGRAQAAVLAAQGEREALEILKSAFGSETAEERIIAIKYLEMLPKVADGKATSLIVPDRLSEMATLSHLVGNLSKRS